MPYLTNEEVAMITKGVDHFKGAALQGIAPSLAMTFGGAASNAWAGTDMVNDINDFTPTIPDRMSDFLKFASTIKASDLKQVIPLITARVGAHYVNIMYYMQRGVAQGVGGLHAGMRENFSGNGLLQSSLNGLIQQIAINPYTERAINSEIQPNIPDMHSLIRMKIAELIPDNLYRDVVKQIGWSDTYKNALESIGATYPNIGVVLDLMRRKVLSDDEAKAIFKLIGITGLMADRLIQLKRVYLEPYRLADMIAKNQTTYAYYKEAFDSYGINEEDAKGLAESQITRPSIGMLADMYWRELITMEEARANIGLAGYQFEMADAIFKTFQQIPPAQDIITMVVREAFEEANIVKAPTEFSGWIAKKGFSEYWADKYWTAHFTPIPIGQAYDNLRRGYRDEAWMKDVLRIADIHPRWHDDIINVAWNPPAIRELGYGYDVGVYNRDDIIKYRRWGGLSLEDATKAADSLIDYRLDAERNAMRTANMNLFINNAINETTFRAELKKYRTNESATDLWVERGKINKLLKEVQTPLTESKSATRSDAQWMYENGLRDVSWFTARLKAMGYSDDSVQLYLDQSNKKISDKNTPDTTTTTKSLSLAQINDFYENKILDRATTISRIMALGYTQADTELMLQVWDKTTPAVPKTLTLSQLTELYTSKDITLEKYKEQIVQMGYTEEDADNIIKIADRSLPKATAQRLLNDSELDQLYLYGYYDAQGLIQQYINRGYSQTDAVLKAYITTISIELPMMKAQYKNAWISETELAQVIRNLITPFNQMGNVEQIINNVMMAIVKNTGGDRIVKERDLTKAEIVKGAKNEVFTIPQAIELLVGMGYSQAEAEYILAINNIVAINDPKGYWDMRQAVELQRKAIKLSSVTIPNELVDLEADVKEKKEKLKEIKNDNSRIVEIGTLAGQIATIEGQMNTIKSRMNIKTRMPA